jgi:hypothetical protein
MAKIQWERLPREKWAQLRDRASEKYVQLVLEFVLALAISERCSEMFV